MGTGLSIPSSDEMQSDNFGILDDDDYIVRIDSYNEVNRVSQYNPEGKSTFDFYLTPVGFANEPEAELVDKDGEPVHPEKHLVFFYDPNRLGTRPMVSRSRQFLASALGVPAEGRIELPGGLDDLIGREIIATVIVTPKGNKVTGTRPIKKRTRVRVAQPETPETKEYNDVDAF